MGGGENSQHSTFNFQHPIMSTFYAVDVGR
jgi:hypothetical protein